MPVPVGGTTSPQNADFENLVRAALLSAAVGLLPLRSPAAEDRHWTTNGVHKGIIGHADWGSGFNPASLVGSCQLSYALWTLVGEPVQDYVFFWKWPEEPFWSSLQVGDARVDGRLVSVSVSDLRRYPDLLERFEKLKPINIDLNLAIEFHVWNSIARNSNRVGDGTKTAKPDLIGQSGQKLTSIVPGSPDWADFFHLNNAGNNYSFDKRLRAQRNKEAWKRAEQVQLTFSYPVIKRIEWPEYEWRDILKEYGKRQSRPVQLTNQVVQATNAPSAAPTNPPPASATRTNQPWPRPGPNPLDPHPAPRPGENPLDPTSIQARSALNPLDPNPRPMLAGNPLDPNAGDTENPFDKTIRLERERREALARHEAALADLEGRLKTAREAAQDHARSAPVQPHRELWLTASGTSEADRAEFAREKEARYQARLSEWKPRYAEWEKAHQPYAKAVKALEDELAQLRQEGSAASPP